jgi:hypothetical protein
MSSDTSRQIKQMVNFIMQEAHEKVNEVKIKVRLQHSPKNKGHFFL